MQGKTTWILVADGQHAAVYSNGGPGTGIKAKKDLHFEHYGPRSHDMMTDKPGRMKAGVGSKGSAGMTPRDDPHETAERHFIEGIVEKLGRAAANKDFDRLLIAAPPRMLGWIRKALDATTRDRVIGEIPKDLTKLPVNELPEHLAEHLAL
jgi:protein required for attachment to host cells